MAQGPVAMPAWCSPRSGPWCERPGGLRPCCGAAMWEVTRPVCKKSCRREPGLARLVSASPKIRSRGVDLGPPTSRSVFDFTDRKLKGGAPGAPEVGAALREGGRRYTMPAGVPNGP